MRNSTKSYLKRYFLYRPSSIMLFVMWLIILWKVGESCLQVEFKILALMMSAIGLQVSLIWWFRN